MPEGGGGQSVADGDRGERAILGDEALEGGPAGSVFVGVAPIIP